MKTFLSALGDAVAGSGFDDSKCFDTDFSDEAWAFLIVNRNHKLNVTALLSLRLRTGLPEI